jgi:hypothetical protein
MIGHLAWQVPLPDLNERVAYGKPATTPPLDEMWAAWRSVTKAGDPPDARASRLPDFVGDIDSRAPYRPE